MGQTYAKKNPLFPSGVVMNHKILFLWGAAPHSMEPERHVVDVQSLNQWTARKSLHYYFLGSLFWYVVTLCIFVRFTKA